MEVFSHNSNIDIYIEEKHVEASFADYLRSLDRNSEKAVEELIIKLSPSLNSLKSLITLLDEISRRDKTSWLDILSAKEPVEILDAESLGRKEKLGRLRDFLETLRYPHRSKLEERISNLERVIRSEFNVKLKLPEELEGDSVEFRFTSRNASDLSEYSRKIMDLSRSPELNELYSILKGEV
ncbi:MAG TPA: hypothetical protein PKA63_06570 [Oligoflexia bacterium]|nr:hypothetical protein [Oligoflexia bacterium]HMP48313.1 hypothetical protein [Oligoflexia bacterium]